MAINYEPKHTHPLMNRATDIAHMVRYWNKVRTLLLGLQAMRDAGEEYLPKFPEETDANYGIRLNLTKLTNVYRDVVEGLATKPFEAEVTILKSDNQQIPTELSDLVENIDGSYTNLTVFSSLAFFNGINDGISWIFVDFPEIPEPLRGRPISKAEAKQYKLTPYWSHVLAINVLEVRTKVIGSECVINYIRILEPSVDGDEDKVRIFERDDNNVVTWKLYYANPSGKNVEDKMVLREEGTLSINVIPLVPFITGRRMGNTWRFLPPMQDAADLQITLYQNESSLEYIKMLAAFPMLAANGMKPQMEADGKKPKKITTGPMQVLYGVPDGSGGHGEWKFIEPQANSMEFLQKNIAQTKQDLRELGRQPLTALSSQLTTVTTSIAAGKGRSAVTAWALNLKDTLENALMISMMFIGIKYEPEVYVFTGFDNVDGTSDDVIELGKARERGDISLKTYWSELQRRKILSPEFKPDEEVKELLNEIPSDRLPPDSPNADGQTVTTGNNTNANTTS